MSGQIITIKHYSSPRKVSEILKKINKTNDVILFVGINCRVSREENDEA